MKKSNFGSFLKVVKNSKLDVSSSLFSTLQEQGPDVFVLDNVPDSSRGDVIRYVRKWNKFKELIIILVMAAGCQVVWLRKAEKLAARFWGFLEFD